MYRIYAKILGSVLPEIKTQVDECFILPMSISEQKRRKFSPVKASVSNHDDNYYSSYITHERTLDPRIIKTGYAIYTDVNKHPIETALGTAIQRFEKVTGTLAMSASIHYAKKHNVKSRYQHYEYQISKIYKIIDGKETDINESIFGGGMTSLIKLPSETNLDVLDQRLIARMLKSKDDVFWKSLSYLQSGEKGFHNNTPSEKMTLDFMKSIELIINLFSGKSFPKRLKNAAKELNIDNDDCESIKKLWSLRSNGDVAHAKRGSRVNSLPAQYPTPSNVDGPYIDSSALAVRVLTNYFLFRDSILSIKISTEKHYDADELIDVNNGTAYVIRPTNRTRKFLTRFLKKKISIHFNVPQKNITLYGYQQPYVHFKIANHLNFDLHKNSIPKKVIIFFGSI